MIVRFLIAILLVCHCDNILPAQVKHFEGESLPDPSAAEMPQFTSLAEFTQAWQPASAPQSAMPTQWKDNQVRPVNVRQQLPTSIFDEFSALLAMDGSKQPQDLGVNANAGLQASMNWGLPVWANRNIGMQIGTNMTATQNAVRVYELLGESTTRSQSFTTVGAFQRLDSGFAWGGVYDFLYEDSFDHFMLGQWRLRASYALGATNELGVTTQLRSTSDTGNWDFNTPITLSPINQASTYWRKFWSTGAQTTLWIGVADRHSEDNIVTGPSPGKDDSFLYGADVFMPLTRSLAIYGETNMITPFDTGTVDAFLGVQWFPGCRAAQARRGKFSPLLPTASPVSFSTDWSR